MFAGEQYDVGVNLYYLRARWYNQRTGRFITADTNEGAAEVPSSLHRYVYAGGDPINEIDPLGESALLEGTYLDISTAPRFVSALVPISVGLIKLACEEFAEVYLPAIMRLLPPPGFISLPVPVPVPLGPIFQVIVDLCILGVPLL
jgi:RHS repeat-associated protein